MTDPDRELVRYRRLPRPGIRYEERPGAYGVLLDGDGRVGVMESSGVLYLPGGGIEAGERWDDALRRELLEEAGLQAGALELLGHGLDHTEVPGTSRGYRIPSTFARIHDPPAVAEPLETHLALRWLPPAEAAKGLRHRPAQRYFVELVAAGDPRAL